MGVATDTLHPMINSGAAQLSWAEVLEQNPDPKVVTDADFLQRIEATGLPWRVTDKATGIEMLLVPPGKFVMGMSPGDTEAQDDEKPAHEVTLTKAFYLGRTAVTQEQWFKVMDTNPSDFRFESLSTFKTGDLNVGDLTAHAVKDQGNANITTDPVDSVSWNDCEQFCAKTGMKLPTEAQWEYACRAGTKGARYGDLDLIAWHGDNAGEETHAVGQLQPNALGFFDMLGNVWEWTNDLYQADYYESCADGVVDPTGPAQGGARVLRGGGWDHDADYCRASTRNYGAPGDQCLDTGCRFARTAD